MSDMTPADAMRRLNEIDRAYPRIESRLKDSPTVMESDAEWLARNPSVNADEWRRLWRAAKGEAA
jgi:chemotaxis regulatin CheY-phosphate phosphatase CheZ